MGVELLAFDLSFEAVLGLHHNVHQFIVVNLPLFDTAQIPGAAFVVDDEGHNAVAQARFLPFYGVLRLPRRFVPGNDTEVRWLFSL